MLSDTMVEFQGRRAAGLVRWVLGKSCDSGRPAAGEEGGGGGGEGALEQKGDKRRRVER